jgi:ubiquinone/menaquinone biosynthesis C-methylase UbiE
MPETSDIWTGKALIYDQARPAPPSALLDLLTQLIHMPHPSLVVDLGSGTGLSTMLWGAHAMHVIGIEPNSDMRAHAINKIKAHPSFAHIQYQEGFAHQTGLPDACADIVTAAQSFHWMEPVPTLAEIARILRPGGLFAAYDYDFPPTFDWELEQIYLEIDHRFGQLMQDRALTGPTGAFPEWPKHSHLDHMRASGHFRFTREALLHHVEQGNAARLLALFLSNARSHQFQLKTITAQEIGLGRLTQAASQSFPSQLIPWYFSYRVRIAIK